MTNKSNEKCNYKRSKVLTEDMAKKCKVGTYYHPTKGTYRSGACKIGETLKKGYTRKSYTKKNGTKVQKSVVTETCVKDEGKAGKTMSNFKVIKITEKNVLKQYGYSTHLNSTDRFKALIKAVPKMSYKTVAGRIRAIRTLQKSNPTLFKKFTQDLNKLKEWRIEHPNEYKTPMKTSKK